MLSIVYETYIKDFQINTKIAPFKKYRNLKGWNLIT